MAEDAQSRRFIAPRESSEHLQDSHGSVSVPCGEDVGDADIPSSRPSRTENTLRNFRYGAVLQGVGLVVAFATRTVFIRTLGAEYLGVEGLFANVLTMLSLAELGVGSAMSYALYKPIALHDVEHLTTLMSVFRRFYTVIGGLILVLGVALTPVVHLLMREVPDIPHLRLIFLLFVTNSGLSYFAAYKRSLLIADQKQYIATFYRYAMFILMSVAQISVLIWTGSYLLYLFLMLLSTLTENVLVNRRANREYPFLKSREVMPLAGPEKRWLVRNLRASSYHRLAGVILNGTDSIVISRFVGIAETGLYSNYLVISTAIGKIFSLGFSSVTASIGNLGTTESPEKNYEVFKRLNFLSFCLYTVSTVSLLACLDPFIVVWAGESYRLDEATSFLFVVNFYLQGMRGSVLTFRNAYGLFWQDRYKPLAEMATNVVLSVLLAPRYGVAGVLMGTVFATLLTCSWVEPLIVFRHGFQKPVSLYFARYLGQVLSVAFASVVTVSICSVIQLQGSVGLLLRFVVSLCVSCAVLVGLFHRSEEYAYFRSLAGSAVASRRGTD